MNEESKKPLAWMRDYESGKGLSKEKDIAYQALFAGNYPISFGNAVKTKKVGVKWVIRQKFNENGEVDKYKARLVAKGYTQEHGVDYTEFKKSMMLEFDMIDLGKMRYFLGIEVMQRSDDIFISQKKYTQEVLERFNMDKCNLVHNLMVPGFKLMKNGDGDDIFIGSI
ncbi:hypothetical protein CK203_056383 [Vitis vinifera]|uniref:Reverse transcriptase Ty1/copia-type domain-containing protein n=1 Tax=Vitis vinifera TaxID=29760 RepID=A0A438GKZ8_VITVI|nr:hypothetical protein CK203_056383 [Vitis vinifera]